MKKLFFFILFTYSFSGYAQVGVGTTNPDSTLDIVATNPTGASTAVDGILIPRVDRQRAQNMTGTVTSTMIYVNSIATGTATGTAANINSIGFYYFDGSVWQKIITGASTVTNWALTGNSGTTPGTNFIGTTDNTDIRIKTGTTPTDRWNISHANNGQLQSYSLGTAALPTYSFQGDTDTGLFSSGANALDLSTGGTARFRIPNADQVHALSLGTAALPFYSFSGQTTTGIFGAATNVLGFSTAATERARFLSTGQLGIGTTTPQGILDITSTTNGILVPRVALTDIVTAAPVVNPQGGALVSGTLVWNTATSGTFPNNVIPGFYYWNGSIWISVTGAAANSWSLTGNGGTNGGTTTLQGTNFIGTTDSQNMDIRTNNTYRGRFSSLGEFFLGTLNTATVGDLQSAVGNATFPWAVNGYTANNGGGVYGSITSGTSAFGAIQGEYYGTSMFGSGITGLTSNTTAGTDFVGNTASAIYGGLSNSAARSFGVFGDTLTNTTLRTGGVLGTDGIASGALGYYSSNAGGTSYAVYGFSRAYQTGVATGRMANPNYINSSIGMGIYGGVIGGWIKGDEYGTVFTGKRFSSYNLGKVISNEDYIVISGHDDKVVSYASTALQPEINSKGIAKLTNGQANVAFEKSFSQLVDKTKPIIVTCTPMGETKGVFLAEVTSEGFKIKENQNGNSSVSFSWIAIGEKTVSQNQELSSEILDKNFESNLNEVMHDENLDGGKAIWSQNGKIHFGDKAPVNPLKLREKPVRGRKSQTEKK
ncbi:MAG TPA: hypothetical protein PKN96_09510 [Flavobacterium sp.]|uniref:hypothetical protein n=1 Tax=Flavobacterium sp. TaxID=239 RepID=UPI002CD92BD4|nr:hypothetical protein [Flavobacterium sp.]HNP33516.1 hypothetical protein [Flavobacterium sp.]